MARRLLYTLIPTHLGILSTLPKQRANSILKTEMNSTQSIYIEITQYILYCHCFFVIEHRLACHRYNYTKIRISSVLQSREEKKKKKNLIAFVLILAILRGELVLFEFLNHSRFPPRCRETWRKLWDSRNKCAQ